MDVGWSFDDGGRRRVLPTAEADILLFIPFLRFLMPWFQRCLLRLAEQDAMQGDDYSGGAQV